MRVAINALFWDRPATGSGQYVLGAPLFQEATLHLENGNTFQIRAPKNSKENLYIQSARLNGRPYTKTYLRHEDIVKGGVIRFEMSSQPNRKWGCLPKEAPYSMSNETR